jgi:hypothetical protein
MEAGTGTVSVCSLCCKCASFWCNSSIYLHLGQSLILISCKDLDSNTHEHSPSSDKDFLFAIIKDANQIALVAAIAWLRSGTLDLLSAASGAAKPRKLARHHEVHIIGTYAFKDLLATRPFPAMRSDCRYRTWCRLGEGARNIFDRNAGESAGGA